jgi:iron complex outermembrane recepter protein
MFHQPHPQPDPATGRIAPSRGELPPSRAKASRSVSRKYLAAAAALFFAAVPTFGAAADDDQSDGNQQLAEITITAAKLRALDQFTPTGSRLGLSAQELPATLDVIGSGEMLGRGFINVEQAADSQAGVISGGSPGDQSQFSIRGFTGNQITVLRNGLYIGPSNMTTRDQNAFNVASVEILKGPASVLYGQGAVAGVVNVVDKAPSFTTSQVEMLAAVGRYGSTDIGIGGTTHVGDTFAIRADFSRTGTQGYIQHDPSSTTEGTVTAQWRPESTLEIQLTVDLLDDSPSTYFGTPLVPASFATDPLTGVISSSAGLAIDKRMEFVNYNVADARIHDVQQWPQLLVKWTPNDHLTLQNFTYYFHAKREWFDAENYVFDPATQLIDRDRFYVLHTQNLLGDEGSASYKGSLFGLTNTAVGGFDYSHLNFDRVRGFPCGEGIYGGAGNGCFPDNDPGPGVNPFDPSPGLFGPLLQDGEQVPRRSPTYWNDYAGFFEDVVDLAAPLKLVTGGRYDRLALTRQNFNTAGVALANGFSETYTSTNWRAGLVYNVNPYLTPYVSWTTGKDPPGTNNIFLVNAPEGLYALSSSRQIEAGVKARSPDSRGDLTASVYDIRKSNMLVQVSQEQQATASQTSKGAELTADFKLTSNWTVSANTAYTDSRYTAFSDPVTGNTYSDVEPADIPRWTGNLWTSVRGVGGLPLELGGGARYIGTRPGNTSNTLVLENYTLLDLYASYELESGVLLTGRVNNLLDKEYVQWADIYYPNQVMLGEPRYFELSIYLKL